MSDIAPRPWFIPDVEQQVANATHAFACVNALHAAGITPEALAKDPECVRKLVELVRLDIDEDFANGEFYSDFHMEYIKALRACGIEVKP